MSQLTPCIPSILSIKLPEPPEREVRPDEQTDEYNILIISGLSGEQSSQVLSRIVSLFSKTVRNRLMSTGLNVTLKHLWPHSETELTKVRDCVTA